MVARKRREQLPLVLAYRTTSNAKGVAEASAVVDVVQAGGGGVALTPVACPSK